MTHITAMSGPATSDPFLEKQTLRTSLTHPLQIAEVEAGPGCGLIGVTFAPGKWQADAATGSWRRDLGADLDVIAAWSAKAVVTLLEKHEMADLKVSDLGDEVLRRKMEWLHLPVRDFGVPSASFEAEWPAQSERLRAMLKSDENIVVHCKGGLGRAGMIAARLLVDLGVGPGEAMARVRLARPGAIETRKQEEWVRKGSMSPKSEHAAAVKR
jgi:protein-tyrosine phosphatase